MAALDESPATSVPAPKSGADPIAVVLVISAPIDRAGIPALCEQVRKLLERCAADVVVCDVGAVVDPDAVTVDALARLALTARGTGSHIRLLHVPCRLQELLTYVGLGDVLELSVRLPLEPGGQTEERKQTRGVEEKDDPRDPAG
ncbi:MAG: STAS domain-containing protein [Actinomycetota bacterium]|nr:STAS domain-containing protein [Actinomycetota bacterium]